MYSNDQQAAIIAQEYNFMPLDDGKYESYLLDYPERMQLHASRHNSMKIWVKYDYTLLEYPP